VSRATELLNTRGFEQNQILVQRNIHRLGGLRMILSPPFLPSGMQQLNLSAGHAVPTRRVLSARRVTLTEATTATAEVRLAKPHKRPDRPSFSSGPCAKPPGWAPEKLDISALGRSHRGAIGKVRLQEAIERTHAILKLPSDYRLGIVPASDTGAMEMAIWSLLGTRAVTMLAWESFGAGWVTDVAKQLKLDAKIRTADYGEIAELGGIDPASDIVFTWNGTTSGVRVPNADWIAADRTGLTICDATSAAFAQDIDWQKVDVGTFSWQKALGGEAAHGMIVLSPRAVERLEREPAPRPLPKIFRLTKSGKLIEGIFRGETINTPSMLAVEDWLFCLDWAERVGGLDGLIARADANAAALDRWVQRANWIEHLARDPAIRSNSSVCLQFTDRSNEDANRARQKAIGQLLEREQAAYDITAYRDAPPGLRIWCGATVETTDIEALGPWLDWAWETTRS
jgi:phosphoserine aminotransferase